jgi:hypothetical protein
MMCRIIGLAAVLWIAVWAAPYVYAVSDLIQWE